MEKKAYLEWPQDRRKCGLFGQTFERPSLHVNLLDTTGTCELQTFTELNEVFRGSAVSLIRTDCSEPPNSTPRDWDLHIPLGYKLIQPL